MKVFRLCAVITLALFSSSELLAQTGNFFQLMENAVHAAPSVQSAKVDIDRAQETAAALEAGPYEFEVFLSGGRRDINDPLAGPNEFSEWEAGFSRTIRLPGKRSADHELADLKVEFAQTKYEKVLKDELLTFIEYWNSWSRLAMLSGVLEEQLADAKKLAELEQKQVDDGAGRQINADQLSLEAELVYLEVEQSRLARINARSALETAYPNVIFSVNPLGFDLSSVSKQITEDQVLQPEQRLAGIASMQARYSAIRARQNRMPDPTFQLSYTDEFDGLENSIMATISMPIGGKARASAYREAEAYSRMKVLDLERAQKRANQNFYSSRQGYLFAIENMERAEKSLDMSRAVLDRIDQGYRIGSMTLIDLIAARRSHRQTELYIIEQTANAELAAMKFWVLSANPFYPNN